MLSIANPIEFTTRDGIPAIAWHPSASGNGTVTENPDTAPVDVYWVNSYRDYSGRSIPGHLVRMPCPL